MLRRSTLPLLLLLAVPACSGEVLVPGETSASATGAGSGSGGVGGSPATTGGSGGSGGLDPTTGVGGAPTCQETHDTLSVSLSTWDGHNYGCNAEMGDYEFSAEVVENSSPGAFVLDSCSPNADCLPLPSKLSISAKGLFAVVPKGTYVRVHVITLFNGVGCEQRIQIKNLPTWGGVSNPVQAGKQLWFLGVEGGVWPFDDSPLDVTQEALGCYPGEPPSCGNQNEDFALRFRPKGNPDDPGMLLPMGAENAWNPNLAGGSQPLVARNLRSFTLGVCNASAEFAYWVAHDLAPN